MELSPLSLSASAPGFPLGLSPLCPTQPPNASKEAQQLRESCRQFEAILWRTVLAQTTATSLTGEAESADPTGTYHYFYHDTLANSISGSSSSFADILYQQLSRHLQTTHTTSAEHA